MKIRMKRPSVAGLVLWTGLLVTVALIAILGSMQKPVEQVEAVEEKPVAVRVVSLELRDIPDIVSLPGRIEPAVQAELAPEKSARVQSLEVDRGDALLVQLRSFLQAVRSREKPAVDGDAGVGALRTALRVLEAMPDLHESE